MILCVLSFHLNFKGVCVKNVKVVSLALGLSVSLSLVSAFDLSNIGKTLEKAQDAGIVTTGIPTKKQYDAKVEANAKASVAECKKFVHKEQMEYRWLGTGTDEFVREEIRDLLAEWDRKTKKPLEKFEIKTFVNKYAKNKKDEKAKKRLKSVCHTVFYFGMSNEEQSAFYDETEKKYNPFTGTEIKKNKK